MPRLVQSDVEEAVRILYRSLDFALSNDGLEAIVLDVPQYLFVSTQVAKHFSHLFECSIVNAFQTCLGGRMVKDLRDRSIERTLRKQHDTYWEATKRVLSSMSTLSVMLLVATLPLQLQR
jgi:hypothetical protein